MRSETRSDAIGPELPFKPCATYGCSKPTRCP